MSELELDRFPDAVLVVRQGRLQAANERAHDLIGGALTIGEHVDELLDLRDDAGRSVSLPSTAPAIGDRYAERVLQLHERGGRRRPMAVTGRWSDGDLVVVLRNAGRREAAIRNQGDVVATVAHEIRSPLTSVKGFTRTLLSRWDRFSDEQKLTMLATIESDADRVTRLLTELLEVSRIDAGRVRLRRTPVDIVALLHSVCEKAQVREPELDVTIVSGGEVAPIYADADKLEQVLTNLIDNAIRHAPGSPVLCSVEQLETGGVHLRVQDAGPGISDVLAPQLFSKFGRGRTDHRSGSGLGLFVSRGLVEAHGGRIWSDPDVEEGALMHVTLPLGDDVASPADGATPADADGATPADGATAADGASRADGALPGNGATPDSHEAGAARPSAAPQRRRS